MEWLQGWSIQELVVFVGTSAIVVGLCNLSFGDKKDDAHLKQRLEEPAPDPDPGPHA